MAQLTIEINGRSYILSCADGEEDRLRGLAAELGRRTVALAGDVGQVGDARLLVMLGLLLLDEVEEARAQGRRAGDESAAAALDEVATRIEALAGRVEQA